MGSVGKWTLVLAAGIIIQAGFAASPDPAQDFSSITGLIQGWVDKGYYPGASLIVVRDGKVVYDQRFGNHNAESVEYLASAGKWLAAATILAVADEGKLKLDDPVSKWLPEFTGESGQAPVRQLLSHTSGYPPYRDCLSENLTEVLAKSLPFTMDAAPGMRWNYGGFPMDVAGRIAELATGQEWEQIFQTRIARPLGMQDTHFTPMSLTPGHTPLLGGGARGSLRDYARFLTMISQDGRFDGRCVLSETAIRELMADQVHTAAVPPDNFVVTARGAKHTGIYGFGLWREEIDAGGAATLVSSPSWAGTYPWLDKKYRLFGFFLAHVDRSPGSAASRDKFSGMIASARLPHLVRSAINSSGF